MHGVAMLWHRQRLQQAGYRTLLFSYPTVRRSAFENVVALQARIEQLATEQVHYLAHSLGGLVVRHLFARYPDQPPGRVVTLGTPHCGSATAELLTRHGLGFALGRSVDQALLPPAPSWPLERQLGSLAGTLSVGLGRWLSMLPTPNDGTVTVAETCCEGMTDHLCLPVSHSSMLFSPAVADQAMAFFATGRFRH